MPILTEDMLAVIRRAILSFVATVNEDGSPHVSPKASLTAREDSLFFADMASPRTIGNLRRNPAIAINVVDAFARRGYLFKGTAAVLPPGDPDFEPVAEWVWTTNGRAFPVHHVVRAAVAEALSIKSPAYTFAEGVREDDVRAAFLTKYGVRAL